MPDPSMPADAITDARLAAAAARARARAEAVTLIRDGAEQRVVAEGAGERIRGEARVGRLIAARGDLALRDAGGAVARRALARAEAVTRVEFRAEQPVIAGRAKRGVRGHAEIELFVTAHGHLAGGAGVA